MFATVFARRTARTAVQSFRKFSGHSIEEATAEASKWTKISFGK